MKENKRVRNYLGIGLVLIILVAAVVYAVSGTLPFSLAGTAYYQGNGWCYDSETHEEYECDCGYWTWDNAAEADVYVACPEDGGAGAGGSTSTRADNLRSICSEDGLTETKVGYLLYDAGVCCQASGSVTMSLPNFASPAPAGKIGIQYVNSNCDGTYKLCFYGQGTIQQHVSDEWVSRGGTFIGANDETCLYGLTGRGVFALVP